jgi:hypothetical protein
MLSRHRRMGGLTLKAKVLGVAFLLVIETVGLGHLTALAVAPGVNQTFGNANTATSTTLVASTGTLTGTGDLLVLVIKVRNTTSLATVSGVTDSASNAWSKAAGVTQGTQADMELWYAPSANGVTTVTATATSASALAETVFDITGALTSLPLDKTATLSGSSTAASTGTTLATSQASEIVVAGIGWNGTVTPSGQTATYTTTTTKSSTATGSATGEQAAWQILSAPGTQTYGATLSGTAAWTGAIATFKLGASAPAPTITNVSPSHGVVGAAVTITGTGFTGTSAVKFNGTTATYHVDSATQITTTVPSGATSGAITVATPGGTATSPSPFTVDASPTPTITGFSPSHGPVGTTVVITGTHFIGTTAVAFHGTTATYHVDSDTQITTTVPTGATTGTITVTTPGGTATSSSFTVNATTTPHIMLIVMENKAYSSKQGSSYVIGSSMAPYINNTLVPNYTSATNWFAVEHNSPRDYLDLISGSNQNLGSGGTRPFSATTLVDELNTNNIRWRGYMESMPNTPCYAGAPTTLYSSIHNPFVFFSNYFLPASNPKAICDSKGDGVFTYNAPFSSSQMKTDLSSANPPAFFWFTPNICNDMHTNGTPCGSNGVANGDTWLSTFIPAIQGTSWYTSGGIIIITWDESVAADTSGGPLDNGGQVPTLVIKGNPKRPYANRGDHYAVLRGIAEMYGVPTAPLGKANDSSYGDLKTAF